MSRRATPTRFVAALLLLAPDFLGAQRAPAARGRIEGVVHDSAGVRLKGAALVIKPGRAAVSDDSGAYAIDALVPGRAELFVRHLGFRPETLAVVVADGRTTRVDVLLTPVVVTLAGVVARAGSPLGKMTAFNTRRGRGIGVFITRADIEKRHASSVSELLRYVPGVTVEQRMAGEPQPVRMQRSANPTNRATCTVLLYVDGDPYPNGSVDDFPPGSLEGIEVYRSASEIPAEFRNRDSMCGLIALWTRDPDAARRHP